MIHRGQKGFTLIELLVVVAILGVIAAVVALSVAGFFGRGTLQAANTELHQAQTAIIAAMAEAESNVFHDTATLGWWTGGPGVVVIRDTDGDPVDAEQFIYGPLRAAYYVEDDGSISDAVCYGEAEHVPDNPWGPTIEWCPTHNSWVKEGEATPVNGNG